EENVSETSSVEEPIIDGKAEILPKDKQVEIIVEKQSDRFNAQQDDNKEVVSDATIQYQEIINEVLNQKPEVKLTDIASVIKEKTGNRIIKNEIVENVAKQMNGIE